MIPFFAILLCIVEVLRNRLKTIGMTSCYTFVIMNFLHRLRDQDDK